MRYMTPRCLRAQGTGLPITAVADADLAGLIEDAEGLMDSFMAFDERNSLGFAAGYRTETQWWDPGTRRFNPSSFPVPVQSIASFTIIVSQNGADGSPVEATVAPNLIVINNDYGYFESVDLAVALYSLAPVLSQLGMMDPFAQCSYLAGYSVPYPNWRCYYDGTLWQSRVPFWDGTQPYSVTRNGAPASGTFATDDGTIAIPGSVSGDVVRATFFGTLPSPIIQAFKGALKEAAGDYFANSAGLAGFNAVRSLDESATRRQPGQTAWRQMLAGFKNPAIAMAGRTARG